jgi:hypothetical protein
MLAVGILWAAVAAATGEMAPKVLAGLFVALGLAASANVVLGKKA